MKKEIATIICTLAALTANAQSHTISGTVKGGNSPYLICMKNVNSDNPINDTIAIGKDGSFSKAVKTEKPGLAYFVYPDIGSTMLFLEDGGNTTLNVTIGKGNDYTLNSISGTNSECPHLMDLINDGLYDPWPFERIDKMSFAEYRTEFLAVEDSIKTEVNKSESLAMRRFLLDYINSLVPSCLYRYGWSNANQSDPSFNAFVESFDRNDIENSDKTSNYIRWYMKQHPFDKDSNRTIAYFKMLKDIIRNQEVVDAFSTEMMENNIKEAPANLAESFSFYKSIVSDKSEMERLQPLYDHYVKLIPGAEAADFTMTDTKGKEWHLTDLRGKAVYIDCWATWCGPCCAEIPYMEKLYDHFKNDKRIELISISLDNNKAKWEKKLKADTPKWKQFICPDNFNSTLTKNYDIDAIPRFLFFDKEGKVISLDAPRPSAENIIEFIEKALQ